MVIYDQSQLHMKINLYDSYFYKLFIQCICYYVILDTNWFIRKSLRNVICQELESHLEFNT